MNIARLARLFLLIATVCPLVASARINETQEESRKRYGEATPAAEAQVILPNATNQLFSYEGWQITAAFVDAKTVRIRYRKGHMVKESVEQRIQDAKGAVLLRERQAKKKAEQAKRNLRNREQTETVSVFKEETLSADEIKTILKSEAPIGNWREYDPKTQSRNAVFSFAAKEVPKTLINDGGIVAHVTATRVTLEKLAAIQELEKQSSAPADAPPAIPKF